MIIIHFLCKSIDKNAALLHRNLLYVGGGSFKMHRKDLKTKS